MASGLSVPRRKAGHMAAPTSSVQKVKKPLANPEPSTHGAKHTTPDAKARKPKLCEGQWRSIHPKNEEQTKTPQDQGLAELTGINF
ncbi:hypothetical protein [Rhizobium sp. LjRoot254]|uniref:hypothetical protein n=1 Tax=Rhizobium sp. LjRoot254 TaxID=3342297 RepID=UPI003ED123C6